MTSPSSSPSSSEVLSDSEVDFDILPRHRTIRSRNEKRNTKNKTAPKDTISIDKYKLGEKLGTGAFSTVYKGLNIENGNFVAVKRIKRKKDEEAPIKFEIELLKTLTHENVVKYIDLVMSENHINVVLEYIDCGSLASILEKFGVFPENLVSIYLEQVLHGLDYLHTNGVTHRDIKGANILITSGGSVKLADFGIAVTKKVKDVAMQFTANVIQGSPFWMAPELIQSPDTANPACDIWSLGCTIIELLEGFPPYFDQSGITALFRMVEDDHPPFEESEVSNELNEFLLRCFNKDPSKRPSAKDLLETSWIQKAVKTGKKENWRKTISKVKTHNTSKRDSTLRSLQNIDWTVLEKTIEETEKSKASEVPENTSPTENVTPPASPVKEGPPTPSMPMSPIISRTDRTSSVDSEGSTSYSSLTLGHRILPLFSESFSNLSNYFFPKKAAEEQPQVPTGLQYICVITGTETRRNFLFSYTVYLLKVCITFPKEHCRMWTVARSFSDFQTLDTKLKDTITDLHDFPELVPMKWFGSMEPTYVAFLLYQLRDYLAKLVAIPQVYESKLMLQFLREDN